MNRPTNLRARLAALLAGGALIVALLPMAGVALAAAPSPPSQPAFTGVDSGTPGDFITNDTTPTFAGTKDVGSTVQLFKSNGTLEGHYDTSTGTSWNITTDPLTEGVYTFYATATDASTGTSGHSALSASLTILTPPSVTIRPAIGQANPTFTSPINFTVVFSHTVTDFVGSDVKLSASTAGGSLAATVTGSGNTYNVRVTGMTTAGTVTASIDAGVANDVAGNTNQASANTDNWVSWDTTAGPSVTINQAAGQADPTATTPIYYTAVFSAPVTGFDGSDVVLSGTAGATTSLVTGGPSVYTVAVSGMTASGTVIATIPAERAASVTGNHPTLASTSIDNTVAFRVASKFLVTSNSYTPVPGSAVTITAQLADSANNAVPAAGIAVAWSSTNGGSFSSATSTTNASGIATVAFTVSATNGTVHTITATGGGFTGTSANITVSAYPATISLTRSRGMVTYGEADTFSVQFGTGGAYRPFILEYTSVGVPWTTIANLTTNAAGFASFSYVPTRTGYVRARFLGTTDLGAATSTVYIVGVRQTVSTLSPHHSGTKAIPGGTSITFSTTVHPTRADLAPTTVTFRIYRKVGGSWVLAYQRTALTTTAGVASYTFRWGTSAAGLWYVRAYAPRTPYNSISRYTAREYYLVQ